MSLERQHLINESLLQCPICNETPLGEVLQCEKGHMLCHQCILKVRTCPQCRVPFGENKIRNLTVEAILDDVLFNCSSEEFGCTLTMKRQEMEAHNKICAFRGVNICRSLGHTNCQVKVQSSVELLNHLQVAHRRGVELDDCAIRNKAEMCVIEDHVLADTTNFADYEYMTAKIKGKIEPFLFLLKIGPGFKGPNFNCALIYLGDGPLKKAEDFMVKIDVDLEVVDHGGESQRICTWTGFPVHFKAAEDETVIPYLSTSMHYIKSRLDLVREPEPRLLLYAKAKLTETTISVTESDSSSSDFSDDEGTEETKLDQTASSSHSQKRNLSPMSAGTSKMKKRV